KRWPIDRWARLADVLRASTRPCVVIAGEVEHEQFDDSERTAFASLGGAFMRSLSELADLVRTARLFVGCDSGPAHLAAQLGVQTLAIFGPTDPRVWSPVGPRVRVLSPGAMSEDMTWLEVGTVAELIEHGLRI